MAAFAFFGGIPVSVLYDNTRLAVAKILGDGNDKGKVEGMVGFARRTFMVPTPRARDFTELNAMLEGILGSDVTNELRVLFSDDHGPDLRNRIAHGQLEHGDFFSGQAVYAWWFIYHLCMRPVRARFRPQAEEAGEPEAAAADGNEAMNDE